VRLRIELHDAINAQHRHIARYLLLQEVDRVPDSILVRLSFNKNSIPGSSKTIKS